MTSKEQTARTGKRGGVLEPRRAGKWWVLLLALLFVLGAGIAYGIKWQAGLRGTDMLRFVSIYLCAPFAIGLLLLFAYFNPGKQAR